MGAIKDFVVRGKDHKGRDVYAYPDDDNGYEPKRGKGQLLIGGEDAACFARLELQAAECTDVAIFRVLADGTEERLPSYEEALTLLGAMPGTIGPMPGLTPLERGFDFVARTLAAALIEAGETPEVHVDKLAEQAAAAIVRFGADPLAALEAAERRLLEAGGWREDSPGWWNDGLTGVSTISTERRSVALTIERRRLAAKGGA